MEGRLALRGLAGAAHPGPTLAVTVLSGLLALASDLAVGRTALVLGAVLTGQLSIGWSNDLLDAARDRQVGRADKPLATGAVSTRLAAGACAGAVLLSAGLSLACGLAAGLLHLVAVVGGGWAYNLGLKATAWSWAPYAVAFGALPVVVTMAGGQGVPAVWVPLAGALLGVGAHLVNVLPDLDDDAATGVRGLPHRLGRRRTPVLAVVVLALASVVIAGGAGSVPVLVLVGGLAAVALLSGVALVAGGQAPFRAAVGIAVVDVLMLVVAR